MNYWLFKTEPDTFSWTDLKNKPDRTTMWDGVRNFRARGYLKSEVKLNDRVLFYHSSCKPQNIAGIAVVTREGYPDPTQFDPTSKYFDETSRPERPKWYLVDVRAEEEFQNFVTLQELKTMPELEGLPLLKKGNRLSIQTVSLEHFQVIVGLGNPRPL